LSVKRTESDSSNRSQLLSDADQQLAAVGDGADLVVNSRVVSASVDAPVTSDDASLTEPVRIRFQHLQKTMASIDDVVCVYWDLVSGPDVVEL
jgi:hypothetical protein